MGKKTLLVTVGTTEFDKLIETVDSMLFLSYIHTHWECENLIVQFGRGKYKMKNVGEITLNYNDNDNDKIHDKIYVEAYDYKSSLADDVRKADLIISHAGAGSIIEALEAKKMLVVVINEDLMDNHQIELAQQLAFDKYLICTVPSMLPKSLLTPGYFTEKIKSRSFLPPPTSTNGFQQQCLDKLFITPS